MLLAMTLPAGLEQWRREQRTELLARRLAVPAGQRRRCDKAITSLLLEGFALGPLPPMVGIYWPFKGEFDPRFAMRQWRLAGARAALPVVLQRNAPLEFREWWPGVRTTRGVYDLPVPQGTALLRPDVLLIPLVGFDARAYRLGYGGGYYDRTLAAMQPQPLKIGVGFELSRMASIDPQPHDIALDFIVTETGIHAAGPRGLERIANPSSIAVRTRDVTAIQSSAAYGGPPRACEGGILRCLALSFPRQEIQQTRQR